MRNLSLLSLFAALFLGGCAYYTAPALPLGSSKAQVQAVLGPPKSSSRDGSVTTWNYGGGTVAVFRDGALIATNYSGQQTYAAATGPVINVAPAPYYYYRPAPVVYAPAYYGGGWGRPYYGGWGGGWGGGYYRGWGGGGWGGGYRGWGGGGGWCR